MWSFRLTWSSSGKALARACIMASPGLPCTRAAVSSSSTCVMTLLVVAAAAWASCRCTPSKWSSCKHFLLLITFNFFWQYIQTALVPQIQFKWSLHCLRALSNRKVEHFGTREGARKSKPYVHPTKWQDIQSSQSFPLPWQQQTDLWFHHHELLLHPYHHQFQPE